MSRQHVYLLQKVKNEFDAARAAIAYTVHYWHYQDKPLEKRNPHLLLLRDTSLKQFEAALPAETVETIFVIRLFAVFEGILKDYHRLRHPKDNLPTHPSVSWYIERLASLNRRHISEELEKKVSKVREYRNSLVHSLPNITPIVFSDALGDLGNFVARLPEV